MFAVGAQTHPNGMIFSITGFPSLDNHKKEGCFVYIRIAEEKDLPALLDIYNDEVLHGISTLDLNPRTMAEWRAWFAHHNVDNHPLLTAELENGKAAGYASLSEYRSKEAYRSSVELSIYVARAHRGKGVATALMETILDMARADDRTHLVVSVITDGNEASQRLHDKFGFTFCGIIPEVGMKFGCYQNIRNYALLV